jgi:multidrug transporter EmrE-like cation transporter
LADDGLCEVSLPLMAAGSFSGSRELAGAMVAAGSALLYDLGYVLEKQALTELPPVRPHPVSLLRTAAVSPRWQVGFAAMLAGLGLQVVALTMAPVSVVQPILAGGLVGLAAVGGSFLDERLGRRQIVALLLVLVAVVAIAMSARSGDQVSGTVAGGRFVALGVPVAVAGGLMAWFGLRSARASRSHQVTVVSVASAAGLLYGLGAVAEKAVATRLVSRGVLDGALSALTTVYPWLFVVATASGMLVFQVGLQRHPATMMATFTNVASSTCALIGASVVFGETLLPPGWWSGARLLGLAAVVGAVVVLARDPDDVTAPAVVDPAVSP